MVDIIIKILDEADIFDLMSLDELKTALNITDTTQDETLSALITRYSDVVATLCNRVFAKETVRETWRCLQSRRLFLSHWPVNEADIESVECPRGTLIDTVDYEVEEKSGKIELYGSRIEPIVVTYTGGFVLPDEAPQALKQATELLIREDRAMQLRQATAGIRSLSHRDARVMFFDPLQGQHAIGNVWQTGDALNNLLMHYVRLQV